MKRLKSMIPRYFFSAVAVALALALLPAPASAQLFGSRNDSEAAVRLNQVEEQMRNLTGQIEQLNFQIRQLQDTIRRMQEDNEYRLQQLEQSGGKRSDAGPGGGTLAGGGDAEFAREGGYEQGGGSGAGPLDLSALARGQSGGFGGGGDPAVPGDIGNAGLPGAGPSNAPGATLDAAALSGGSPRGDYDAAYAMVLAGDYAGAETGFTRFLENHPNDPLAANAQFWLGESYFARKQYRDAADAFLKSYTDYPDSNKVTDSLLKLGLSLKGIGQKDAACATFNELLTKYPGAPTAVRAEAQAQKQSGGCA
jgi:tol-pal system protein YbgF